MRITLDQIEVEKAVQSYINNLIAVAPGTHINIEFSKGRGETGISAEVNLSAQVVESEPKEESTFEEPIATVRSSALEDLDEAAPLSKGTTSLFGSP